MNYARDLRTGTIVEAAKALNSRSYACPRPGCGGRVYAPDVIVQRPHFRHYPGEGTSECDEYFPGIGSHGDNVARTIAGVEDEPAELGLLLAQVDGLWALGLRLPEIPSDELKTTSLSALRTANVDVYSGLESLRRVSALELRPGVGFARVDVSPRLQSFRTEPVGLWPASVGKQRWVLETRGLEATGSLFRLRSGEWTRLLAESVVYLGETLLVIADGRSAPPDSIISETYGRIPGSNLQWALWEIRIPGEPVPSVFAWLDRLGHAAVPGPWRVGLITPPRGYGAQGEPVFWVDDSPVLVLEAPQPNATATVTLQNGPNTHSSVIRSAQTGHVHVRIGAKDSGLTRLVILGERRTSVDFAFIQCPQGGTLTELLGQPTRLRIQIGQQLLTAWQEPVSKIRVPVREKLQVIVDLGHESARARVTVWERRKQSSKRGLDARGVTREIEEALKRAERIEIDAENLGRIALLPVGASVTGQGGKIGSRLAWRDHVVSMCPRVGAQETPTLLERPRTIDSFATRRAGPAELIRSRVALRQRRVSRGTRL